jgi:hypothetical protein
MVVSGQQETLVQREPRTSPTEQNIEKPDKIKKSGEFPVEKRL